MRLDNSLMATQSFLENLGYLRLAAFYAPENASQGKLIQKVARVVIGLFFTLSIYDFLYHFLPFKIKAIINGSLVILITCVSLSWLLKRIHEFLGDFAKRSIPSPDDSFNEYAFIEEEIHSYKENNSVPLTVGYSRDKEGFSKKEKNVFSRAKRNLLTDFERMAE